MHVNFTHIWAKISPDPKATVFLEKALIPQEAFCNLVFGWLAGFLFVSFSDSHNNGDAAAAARLLVMSNSVQPHRRQPTRFCRPWDSPGKNTGVGCHFLLQGMKVKSESEVAQLCPTLSAPMDCSLPGSSIHGIFQARVLEWGAIAFYRFSH